MRVSLAIAGIANFSPLCAFVTVESLTVRGKLNRWGGVNGIGPEGAALLVPALEKMPQLTSLRLTCALIRFWARPSGAAGSLSLVRAVGYALGCDVAWLGYALEGGRCGRRFARCVLRGRAAMDAGNEIGPEGAASLAPALEKMPQLTSLCLECARIRFGRRA